MNEELIHVFLVDDDEDDYVLTHDLLAEAVGARFELEWADTYEAGLETMEQAQHDVYLVDYRLGERDGLELLHAAIASGCKAPIIMLTGRGDRAVDVAAIEAGAADYLDKGEFSAPLLERSIRYAIQRQRAEEKLEHLNLVLRAIRSVNQLIVREKDRDRLLQGVCDNLIETHGYHNAWIALLDEAGRPALSGVEGLVATAEAGLGEEFTPLAEQLKRDELTACGRRALTQSEVVVTEDPLAACVDCPLAANYGGRGALTIRLEHGEKIYGLLSASIPAHLTADREEQTLFREVARDIAFALHDMELEEERQRAEEEVQRRAAQAALAYEVGQRVSAKLELDKLLSEIVTAVREAFDYYGAMILLVDEEAKCLTMQSIAGGYAEMFPVDLSHAIGEGMVGYAAASGEVQISGDVSKDPHYIREAEEETKSELAVPIKREGKVIGVLDIQSDQFDVFDETDVMAMETLADQIAVTIENARLYQEVQQELADRKRAEEALQTSEARYRAVVESQTELIDRWLPNGTVTFVNDAYCRYYGKPREELMGQKWITHVAEEDQERAKAYIEHLITSLNPANPTAIDEHREIAADGSIRWQQWIDQAFFDEQGHLVEFQSVGRDITAHRQAEEALRASERRFRALTENSADGIALLDATGAIRYESPTNAQALGYSVGELVGTNVFDLVHPDDIQSVSLLLSALVEKPETPLTIQFRFRHKDGSWCWLEATGNNLLAEPAVQAIVVNYRDITERQRAEEVLRLRMEQLTALSRASQVVTASLELDRVLAEIVSLAGEVVGSGYVSVVLMDEAGHMSQSAENLPGVPAIEYRIRDEGFTSWIVRSRQAVVVDETGEDGAVSPDPGEGAPHTANPILVEAGIRSFVGLPLIAKARLLGVLYLHSLRPGAFHGQLSLLTAFANQAATAIEKARLYKAVQQELADRKQAEEALRESEERYRLLFERNLAGVYTTTLDGDILDCNEAFAQIFGYDSREQLLADEARELFDAADREEFTAQLRQEGALLGREWLLRRTDGSPVWVLENSNLIEGEEGRLAFVQGTLIDITERKQAEEALRESEERFRAIAEATPIPVVITRASDSMILYANEEYGKALGVPIRELLGRRSVDYYGDADERRIILDKLSKDGRLEGYELQGKRGDGTPFWTVVSALLLTFDGEQAIFTAFQDITERKRAEERIKFLAEVLDTSPLSVIATDKGEKIIYVNPATERLFGYTSDELLGKNPIILNADPNADKIQRDIFDTIGQGRVWRGEILNRKKNGEVFPIYASVYQLLDEEGNFIAVVGFQEDITERKRAEEALIRLSNAVKMSTDSIVISDLETIIIDVNEATLKMYGTDDRRDLIGRSSLDLIAPEDRERAFAGMQQALGKGYVKSREYCIITKDGSRIPVEVSAALLKDAAGEPIGFVGVSRDITERVRAERLLRALDHAAVAMGKALTPEEIFTTVAEELKKLGFSCTVLLADESQKRLLPKYFRYEAGAIKTAEKLVSLKAEDFFIPVEAVDVYRKVIRERRAVFVENVEEVVRQLLPGPAKRFAGQIAKMLEVSKSIAAPLIVEDEIIGLLSVQSGDLTKDDIPAIIAFAHQMAAAWHKAGLLQDLERSLIERERTQKELRQSHAKLQRALEGTVHTLVATIELKDPYTGRHQRQVAQLACAMAEEMGLPQEQIEGLRMAGLIHDLGKITVPAEILSKPGRLSDLEYGLIRMHPQTGYDVLKDMDFPWLVADIVLQHHERLDGSGYPQGLSGDEIMLEARILAVADVVAAMASHRPYRSARGLDEALEEIFQNRGILYDPEVVDVCLTLFTEKRFTFE